MDALLVSGGSSFIVAELISLPDTDTRHEFNPALI